MEQRYYRTVTGNLNLREWQCWKPGVRGFAGWLVTRVIPLKVGEVGMYLPTRFADIQATQQELSPRALSLLMPLLAECEGCGFRLASFVKMVHNLNPKWLDGGGCWLLHTSGQYTGVIIYTLVASTQAGAKPVENVALYCMCRLQSQHVFGVTNTQNRFDSLPGTTVLHVNSPHPAKIFTHLQQKVQPFWSQDPPWIVSTLEEMAAYSDMYAERKLKHLIAQKLFFPMTPGEIAAAQAEYAKRRPWPV